MQLDLSKSRKPKTSVSSKSLISEFYLTILNNKQWRSGYNEGIPKSVFSAGTENVN